MHLARLGSFIFYWFLGLALLASPIAGQCNLCSVFNNLACVSQTEYQFCINGSPVGAVTSCPDGYVCSTLTSVICQSNQNGGGIAACDDCNVCDTTGTFACIGTQTYALCLGGTTPSDLIGSCAPNYVCNIDLTQICGDVSLGVVPTCPTVDGEETTTTTIATTVSPLTNPQQYCRNLQQYGRFPVGSNVNSTCQQFVFCVVNSGIWSGQLYDCPGRTYFNSSSRLCVDAIPDDCS